MKLLKSQTDFLYEQIFNHELHPSQFELIDDYHSRSGETINKIVHKSSEYFFKFIIYDNAFTKFECSYSPSQDSFVIQKYLRDWQDMIVEFHIWLNCLEKEIYTPDYWNRFSTEYSIVSDLEINRNTDKFSAFEYKQLQIILLEFKNKIQLIDLTQSQIDRIEEKIDDLTSKAIDMNKFDWTSLFLGTLFSIFIQLEVTHENINKIFSILKTIFSRFLLN